MNRFSNYFAAMALTITSFIVINFQNQLFAQNNARAEKMISTLKGKKPKMRGFKTPGEDSSQSAPRVFYAPTKTRGAAPMKAFFADKKVSVEKITAPSKNPYAGSHGDLGIQEGQEAYKFSYNVDKTSLLTGEIFFWKGKSTVKDSESHAYLKDLATALRSPELKNYKFIIEGHASAEGHAVNNKWLSQERANAIFHILVNQYHVNPNQVYPAGFGEDEARYDAHSPEYLLAKDRRVLIYKMK